MTTVSSFLKDYWPVICAVSAVVSASTVFCINFLTIRKLRLEIDRLKQAHGKEQRRIITATEEQIEKYGTPTRMVYFKGPRGLSGGRKRMREPFPMGLQFSQDYWQGVLLILVMWTALSFFVGRFSSTFWAVFGFLLFVAIYYVSTYIAFKYLFEPNLDAMRKIIHEHKVKLKEAAEQIVGRERRERVSQLDSSRDA